MENLKKKISITYFITESNDEYDFKCAQAGTALNGAIWDALQKIRSRLKYGENVSESEIAILEELRSMLYEFYIEE